MTQYELHQAVEKGDLRHVRELLSSERSGIDVNEHDEKGLPPLVYATEGDLALAHLLLQHGANAHDANFTPLFEAVAFGSFADVEALIKGGIDFEERDYWERTAWLLAIQIGDIAKARLLLEHGADGNARGSDGKSSLFYAIEYGHGPMLQWLLEIGTPLEQMDDFDHTPLVAACECRNKECIEILLKAGAHPREFTFQAQRMLLGYPEYPDEKLFDVSQEDFFKDRSARFGAHNPEQMNTPFWEAMIRSGINAYQAGKRFDFSSFGRGQPTWCAQRFGQSLTLLPDDRIVQVAGEHEDYYDPDFCIYNDVFVHDPDGTIHIYGYPEAVFPPTDFHSATLIGSSIYLIGSLGYAGKRHYGETPVYRLGTHTFQIERLETTGSPPGWIHDHRAMQSGSHEIRVMGGKIATLSDGVMSYPENTATFILDIEQRMWYRDQSSLT